MSSFLSIFKTGQGPSTPTTANAPAKKDPHAPQPTPLEKLLADAGPLRVDGSDKFFGFENFGSTCYCNSIVQCLYYSIPFREQVVNFPSRSPQDALQRPPAPLSKLVTDLSGANGSIQSPKGRNSLSSPTAASPRKPGAPPVSTPGQPGLKPEDNKDSPEYKKKQALAVGPVISMDYENSSAYGMSESLFTSLKDIFEAIIAHRSRIGVVSPHKFLEILRSQNDMWRTPMHQDAHEFLNLLLNEVVENVEKYTKPEPPKIEELNGDVDSAIVPASNGVATTLTLNTKWVHELFEGVLTSETRCLTCENTSQRDEAFLDLSVDLEEHSSVTSCLRKFSEEEMLCERNKFHCDNCGGLQEAEKRMKIKRLPRILALHLKRFKYTEDLQRLHKLFHRVVYPFYLRLFNTTDDAEDPDRLYELYAVVVHIGGGPYHGHYVSIIKTPDRGWLLFDDEMVEPVDKNYVKNFFGGDGVLACAYVLFYQETTEEKMQKEQEAEGLEASRASEAEQEGAAGKVNGLTADPLTPNGEADPEQFVNLDHAATVQPPFPPHEHTPLDHATTAPAIPVLSPKKSKFNLQSRKESSKEEKERKAAEKEQKAREKAEAKEAQKLTEAKRKEAETMRRENYRKQEEELQKALSASKLSKAEEDKKNGTEGGKEGGKLGGLSRFRHTSMSLRHKPKLWPSRDKSEGEGEPVQNPTTPGPEADSVATPTTTPDTKEKMKNRFSLGRKKSSMLH